MNLSEHFTLEELVLSQSAMRMGINNDPDPAQVANLTRLCHTLLEPVREILRVPLHIDSGFRSVELNRYIGGAPDSAHIDGRAADLVPLSASSAKALEGAFILLRTSSLPYDQCILECNAWIHIAIAPFDAVPRRQALTATGRPGAWKYHLVGENA